MIIFIKKIKHPSGRLGRLNLQVVLGFLILLMVPIMLQLLPTRLPACMKMLVVMTLVKIIRHCFVSSLLLKISFFLVIINTMIITSVENVDKCLHAMKLRKSAGCDGIETEQMFNAHPILVSILSALFTAMLQHGYVPDNIGRAIIPLIKDESGDVSSSSRFSGITLSSNISKLFEMYLLDLFGKYLTRSDLQFGFKNGVGCKDAIYALQSLVDFYTEHESTVNLCLLDISKAFDKVNHYCL